MERIMKKRIVWIASVVLVAVCAVVTIRYTVKPKTEIPTGEVEPSTHDVETYDDPFNLDCKNGLNVYIWQMGEGNYSCAVRPAMDRELTPEELFDLYESATSLEEMQEIVASYFPEIDRQQVHIIPIQMPHSSYYQPLDDAYRAEVENLFWSDFPVQDE